MGHKRGDAFPELTAVVQQNLVQILIDVAGPCRGG